MDASNEQPDRFLVSPGTGGPLPALRARIAAGSLQADPAQLVAAERLQLLCMAMRNYDPPLRPAEPSRGLMDRLLRRKPAEEADAIRPHGLYLVGDVGRGKSMLMDLFFESAPVVRKRRVHFHRFMQEFHGRLHAGRHEQAVDQMGRLADAVAADAALLCFDEFQVTDIADAMILGRLFQALFDRGVVVVATSNTPPGGLFEGQPGRDAFLPFIALIERTLDVLVLDSARDYRRIHLRGRDTWHVPADAAAERALDDAFAALAGGAPPRPERLRVQGRVLGIPAAAAGVARFDFAALCDSPLGPGDYLAIATHYDALVLDRVPVLTPDRRDAARRFMMLIDTLYDHRTKLVVSSAVSPDALCPEGDWAAAFARTASRLIEMQSEAWFALPHLT